MERRLFEVKGGKRRWWQLVSWGSTLIGLILIWAYRASHVPAAGEKGRYAWMAVFAAELWFGFYWLLGLSLRWNPIYHLTFKDRLSHWYDDKFPGVDVFICTADPIIEPPMLVINTILSALVYDYPSEKLSVYLSDDGCSILTFYALFEASQFAKSWIPFCKKYNVQTMAPTLFFSKSSFPMHDPSFLEWTTMKKLYKDMESRVEEVIKQGDIPKEMKNKHEGFLEWSSKTTSKDHQAIVKILADGRDQNIRDSEGFAMPTIVYMAREKHPNYHHNFKAGALNALLRVSGMISNGPIILTNDCDMFSNNNESIKDALCFFMDQERGHQYAYVQFPQTFGNLAKNDLYANSFTTTYMLDFPGLDFYGGTMYIGSCCFHRRDCLNGKKYSEVINYELKEERLEISEINARILEERAKYLAVCSYEKNTQWGNEIGIKYGCSVEDIITGFSILCRGWKSVFFSPVRDAFLGFSPATLSQVLIQHKRWSEGHLQLFFSKHCPFISGFGRTKVGLQMGYSFFHLWALNSIPMLIYVSIPSVCLLDKISLFPSVYSFWFFPFAYVITSSYVCSLFESLTLNVTVKTWWNKQRMWLYKRITSFIFALVDATLELFGFANSTFVITPKVIDEEASTRYDKEIMEFGSTSIMFTMLSTVSMLNIVCLAGGMGKVVTDGAAGALGSLLVQFLLSGFLVLINLPIYRASFLRNDKGSIHITTTLTSIAIVTIACFIPIF